MRCCRRRAAGIHGQGAQQRRNRTQILSDDINQAFDNNEFCFYLQPKCNAETGAIVGAEALVRWNHPEYGLVSPGEFIPLLERESMVTRFDLFIWRSVCKCCRVGMGRGAIWCRCPSTCR
ncbi:MAG: EAL domain-containing protein [Bifidobacterium pseudocatenulatum]